MRSKILVTGGAGYIGSHVARELCEQKHEVVVVDLLREKYGAGNKWAVPDKAQFIQGDIGDPSLLQSLLPKGDRFDAILHFAAYILVEESVREPQRYFENNTEGSRALFEFASRTGVKSVIFSSTAATYGEPKQHLIPETAEQLPVNPYGESKLRSERILVDVCRRSVEKMKFVGLRYFNPAGAHHSLEIGQARPEATHLVNVAAEAAIGKRSKVMIFGDDYPTPDGTCLRDYIHIEDLVDAHLLALDYLKAGGPSDFFNVGYGEPFSVRQVIDTMMQVSGRSFAVEVVGRRSGDPARLAADSRKIQSQMGWKPKRKSLEEICGSQFLWEIRRQALGV